jgi:predicted nucleic acid-binding protein
LRVRAEYEEVLGRDRLAIPPEKVLTALARIREKGFLVTPSVKIAASACPDDPDDLIFLECAEAAAADYLITGNRKHFPDQWKTVRIVSVREFGEMVTDIETSNAT